MQGEVTLSVMADDSKKAMNNLYDVDMNAVV